MYGLTGDQSKLGKHRFPICHGPLQALVRRIASDVNGRRSRFRQAEHSRDMNYLSTMFDFAELHRLGYSCELLQRAWHSACSDPYIVPVGPYAIRQIRALEAPRRKDERRAFLRRALYSDLLHHLQGQWRRLSSGVRFVLVQMMAGISITADT